MQVTNYLCQIHQQHGVMLSKDISRNGVVGNATLGKVTAAYKVVK
jgi:hypothetical protein